MEGMGFKGVVLGMDYIIDIIKLKEWWKKHEMGSDTRLRTKKYSKNSMA